MFSLNLLFLLLPSLVPAMAHRPIDIYWNTTNPMFRRNTPAIQVNEDRGPWDYDQVYTVQSQFTKIANTQH